MKMTNFQNIQAELEIEEGGVNIFIKS